MGAGGSPLLSDPRQLPRQSSEKSLVSEIGVPSDAKTWWRRKVIRMLGALPLLTRMRWTVWSAGLIPAAAGAVHLSGIMGDPAEAGIV